MIVFDDVVKRYADAEALDGVSLTVDQGELVALIGPSGAGKSTLLRLVNRLIEPDSGRVLVGGEDIAAVDPVLLRRRLGYAIQSVGLFPHWTVAENIATVPRLLGWTKARIQARVEELLALVNLDAGFAARMPHQLSGGQQQRVGVARALAADPEILLMDEPFGAVDAVTRDQLQVELARIHKATGKTILLVTHDIDEAVRLATKVAVLSAGRLVQYAPPAELITAPADELVATLIGGEAASLKLLRLRRAGDLAVPGTAAGAPLATDATLEAALARMLADGVEALPVAGDRGVVRLVDLVRRRR